ncbi:MAG: RES domain-containing protein [Thermomicrobiales bacterium]
MTLAGHLRRWSDAALRHIPAGSPFDVLDFRFAGLSADNRWHEPGVPTLYLAGDEGVLIAEWGRHFATNRAAHLQALTVERNIFRLALTIDAVLDLRREEVCTAIAIENAPFCFADIAFARATARFIRSTTQDQRLLVLSLGFIDDFERWGLVLFLEKLPPNPDGFISAVTPCGPLRWG